MILQILCEGPNYDDLFNPINSTMGSVKRLAKYKKGNLVQRQRVLIDWAKKNLKKKDKIMWFLRCARIGCLAEFIKEHGVGSYYDSNLNDYDDGDAETWGQPRRAQPGIGVKQAHEALQDLLTKYEKQFGIPAPRGGDPSDSFENQCLALWGGRNWGMLNHFIQMEEQVPAIKNYKWNAQAPLDLIYTLQGYEKEWRKEAQAGLDQGKDQTLVQFPNGWRWVWLDRGACKAEGEAMGHCGNGSDPRDGTTILSLREPIKNGRQKPHLTFILSQYNTLGEMKGRYNQRPSPDLHPYIVELLLTKADDGSYFIQGIDGGGYLPANNFAVSDLLADNKETGLLDKLYDARPEIEEYPEHWSDQSAWDEDNGCPHDNVDFEGQDMTCADCGVDLGECEHGDTYVDNGHTRCQDCGTDLGPIDAEFCEHYNYSEAGENEEGKMEFECDDCGERWMHAH